MRSGSNARFGWLQKSNRTYWRTNDTAYMSHPHGTYSWIKARQVVILSEGDLHITDVRCACDDRRSFAQWWHIGCARSISGRNAPPKNSNNSDAHPTCQVKYILGREFGHLTSQLTGQRGKCINFFQPGVRRVPMAITSCEGTVILIYNMPTREVY